MEKIHKYPRTAHVEGSKLQRGDEDLSQVRLSDIDAEGAVIVVEEKVDGANAGISFDVAGVMHLQSRGHFLVGGPREKHWDLFKRWASYHEGAFLDVLTDRYVMYGEWMYAKHTVFYDLLPHYFMEFDVLDKRTGEFLSTEARRKLLYATPVRPVLVLEEFTSVPSMDDIRRLVRPSYFKTGNWRKHLGQAAERAGVDPELALRQTDASDDMEGLYIKVERGDRVVQRLKWVRPSFLNSIMDSETHWLDRPVIPNVLSGDAKMWKW